MSRVVSFPLPSEFSEQGIEHCVSDLVGCEAQWIANHEVQAPTWWGFVHEYLLAGHPTATGCFVVRCKGDETYTYLKDSSVPDADSAVRTMLADSQHG